MTTDKLENYIRLKSTHADMVKAFQIALNIEPMFKSQRDKYAIRIGDKWHNHGETMGFLTAYHGYYGDSNCSYIASPYMAEYVIRAINKMMPKISELAIELSKYDLEKARMDIEKLAKSVLEDITETKS